MNNSILSKKSLPYLRNVFPLVVRRFLILLVCFIPIAAYTQPVWLLHKPYADKFRYIDSLQKGYIHPALSLQEMAIWAKDNHDAEFASQLKLAGYWSVINGAGSKFPVSIEDLEEFKTAAKGQQFITIETIQLIGDYYLANDHKNSWALESYLEAYNGYKDINPDNLPGKRRYLYALAGCYFRYNDYENAIRFFKQALKTPGVGKDELINTISNTMGICYQKMGRYDSSEFYLLQVYNNAVQQHDSVWSRIAGQNIGITYFLQKKYPEAIEFLEKDMENAGYVNRNARNAAVSMRTLAEIHYIQKDFSKAEKQLQYALSICRTKPFWPDYQLAKSIYGMLYKVYTAEHNIALANVYADSAMHAADSAMVREISMNQTTAAEKAELVGHKFQATQLLHEQYTQSVIRNSLIVIIILIMIIGILFINRQKIRQNKLEAEKKNAEAELNAAVAQLDSFKNSVQEKNLLIEHFSNEMERMKKGEEEKADNELISKLEQSIILTDEQWENFRLTFEKVHKGFFAALKKKMPDLTQSEIRFLALTKLKLTSKEMAAMLGISANTIRSYRHRLRKKFDMDKDGMMDELLEDI